MNKKSIKELHKQYSLFDSEISVRLIHQYSKVTKEWKFYGYRCNSCDSSLKLVSSVQKHINTCKEINTIKKREIYMPIQVITIKGEKYYRWGDSGKPYKDRADAEKQAAAAYASGYKEPKKDMQKK